MESFFRAHVYKEVDPKSIPIILNSMLYAECPLPTALSLEQQPNILILKERNTQYAE